MTATPKATRDYTISDAERALIEHALERQVKNLRASIGTVTAAGAPTTEIERTIVATQELQSRFAVQISMELTPIERDAQRTTSTSTSPAVNALVKQTAESIAWHDGVPSKRPKVGDAVRSPASLSGYDCSVVDVYAYVRDGAPGVPADSFKVRLRAVGEAGDGVEPQEFDDYIVAAPQGARYAWELADERTATATSTPAVATDNGEDDYTTEDIDYTIHDEEGMSDSNTSETNPATTGDGTEPAASGASSDPNDKPVKTPAPSAQRTRNAQQSGVGRAVATPPKTTSKSVRKAAAPKKKGK